MALLTLAQAKSHLRIDTTDADVDIQLKLDQAEAIILDYLKNPYTSIVSFSVASPTVITTAIPHGLTSGVTYTIAGAVTTPTVNGAQVVTVTSPTTFTVPIAVNVGEADSDATVSTPAYTAATASKNVQACILLMLTRLYEQRGDLEKNDADVWLAIERLLMRQRDPALA